MPKLISFGTQNCPLRRGGVQGAGQHLHDGWPDKLSSLGRRAGLSVEPCRRWADQEGPADGGWEADGEMVRGAYTLHA